MAERTRMASQPQKKAAARSLFMFYFPKNAFSVSSIDNLTELFHLLSDWSNTRCLYFSVAASLLYAVDEDLDSEALSLCLV